MDTESMIASLSLVSWFRLVCTNIILTLIIVFLFKLICYISLKMKKVKNELNNQNSKIVEQYEYFDEKKAENGHK